MDTLVGGVAAILAVSLTLPQILKTYRTKQVRDLSTVMWVMFLLSQVLWVTYGFLRDDIIIMLTNYLTSMSALVMLYMIHRYKKQSS